jgi:hypothetical protein
MEAEHSLPCSQEPATDFRPETDKSSPHPHPMSLRSILVISSHLRLGLPNGLFSYGFPAKPLYAATLSPQIAIHIVHLILPDLTILITFDEVDTL